MRYRFKFEQTLTREAEVEVDAEDEESAFDAAWDKVYGDELWKIVEVLYSTWEVEDVEPPDGYKGDGVFADNH